MHKIITPYEQKYNKNLVYIIQSNGFQRNFRISPDFGDLDLHDHLADFKKFGYKMHLLSEIRRLRYVLAQILKGEGSI